MRKNFMLAKGIRNHNGAVEGCVYGTIRVFLNNVYNTDSPITVRQINTVDRDGNQTVMNLTNVEASFKVNEFDVSALKYFFGEDVAVDEFVNISITISGKRAEAFLKFNPKKGDCFEFGASNVELESFDRRDGSKGHRMNVRVFDFDAGFNRNASGNNNRPDNAAPAANNAAPAKAAAQTTSAGDMAAVDDSDDLPF